MDERSDDTPEPATRVRDQAAPRPARRPGSYYYDDATGYEVYDPEADEDEADEDRGERGNGKDAGDGRGESSSS